MIYVFDTNRWLYYQDEKKRKLDEVLSKIREKYVSIFSMIELSQIISDSYKIFSSLIRDKILVLDWDKLSQEERIRVINGIDPDTAYDEVWQKYYSTTIPRRGIRQYIFKKFFDAYKERLLTLNKDKIEEDMKTDKVTRTLQDYVNAVVFYVSQTFKILKGMEIKIIIENVIYELQLIDEGIRKAIKTSERTPGRFDQLIFKQMYILLRENIYDRITFVTDDKGFQDMYNTVIKHLEKDAEFCIEVLKRLRIIDIEGLYNELS